MVSAMLSVLFLFLSSVHLSTQQQVWIFAARFNKDPRLRVNTNMFQHTYEGHRPTRGWEHYDNATGILTAPVDGKYSIEVKLMGHCPAGSNVRFAAVKNSETILKEFTVIDDYYFFRKRLRLNANDTLQAKVLADQDSDQCSSHSGDLEMYGPDPDW